MIVGYARVSTGEQNLDSQIDALEAAGCERIWFEKMTGTKADRPEWNDLVSHLRAGDTLVVWQLDRVGRSLVNLVEIMNELQDRKVDFRCLTGLQVDTSTPTGKLLFHMFAAIAEYQAAQIKERTNAGLAAARARGKYGGRPPALTPAQKRTARKLYEAKEMTVAEIATHLGVSVRTISRVVASSD